MPVSLLTRGLGFGTPGRLLTRGLVPGAVVVSADPGSPIAALLFAMRRRRNRVIPPLVISVGEVWNGSSWDTIAWCGSPPRGMVIVNRRSLLPGRVGTRTHQ